MRKKVWKIYKTQFHNFNWEYIGYSSREGASWERYFGSSPLIRKLQKHLDFSEEAFKTVLATADSKAEAKRIEKSFTPPDYINQPHVLNEIRGGGGDPDLTKEQLERKVASLRKRVDEKMSESDLRQSMRDGLSVDAVVSKFGFSRGTVIRRLREYGIDYPKYLTSSESISKALRDKYANGFISPTLGNKQSASSNEKRRASALKGRPERRADITPQRVKLLLSQLNSMSAVATFLNCSRITVMRRLNDFNKLSAEMKAEFYSNQGLALS